MILSLNQLTYQKFLRIEPHKKNQLYQKKEIKKEESFQDQEKSLETPLLIKKNKIDQPKKTDKLRVVQNQTKFPSQLLSKMPETNQALLKGTISEVYKWRQKMLLS